MRTANIDPTGNTGPEAWNPAPEALNQSYEYIKAVLNDLDVIINKKGEGDTYGVTHFGDGDKVEELESFIATGSQE